MVMAPSGNLGGDLSLYPLPEPNQSTLPGGIYLGNIRTALNPSPNDSIALLFLNNSWKGTENPTNNGITNIESVARFQSVGGEAADFVASTANGSTGPWANNIQGVGSAAGHQTSGTVTWLRAYGGFVYVSGSGTASNGAVFYAYNLATSLNQFTTQYGFYIETPTHGTNNVGGFIGGGSTLALWINSGIALFGGLIQAVAGVQSGDLTTLRSTLWSVAGVPPNTLGANGDFAFRQDTPGTANQRLYIKSAGAWVALTL